MTSKVQGERISPIGELIAQRAFITPKAFAAMGGLTLTVGPETQIEGFRYVAVEADDRNGALERLCQTRRILEDRMVHTVDAVVDIDFSDNPEQAYSSGKDLHVLDAIVSLEVIQELKQVMPVLGLEQDTSLSQAA